MCALGTGVQMCALPIAGEHGRAPQHGKDRDIFERLYAVRLDRLRALEECRSLLAPLDRQELLTGAEIAAPVSSEDMDADALMRSEEHASELQSLMRISYAVFCLKKKKMNYNAHTSTMYTACITTQ